MHERILMVGVNWLGDAIMSMPALQVFRERNPEAHITVLTKPALAPLWRLHTAPDEIVTLRSSFEGTFSTASVLRGFGFARCYIGPHSFRSAIIPWLARIPERVGLPGHARDYLLTRVVALPADIDRRHQSDEIAALLGLPDGHSLPAPRVESSDGGRQAARSFVAGLKEPLVALIPGAARGPAKRWPERHFAELGRRLVDEAGAGVVLLGTAGERELCARLASSIPGAVSLAGATDLDAFAAVLGLAAVVCCNDSGGMHLAAAVGTPVVAVYGLTDPVKTGPLGSGHRVLRASAQGSRDIARSSAEAEAALAALSPETVYEAARAVLEARHA